MASLQARGVRVTVHRADVAEPEQVDELLKVARSSGRLAGLFHAAMVLDDGAIELLTEERFARVLAPKADGAWHLHRATWRDELDHFVLFSSIASVLGTPGQGNYAAANAFLDELAEHRRALGRPGLSINWGVIDDVGVVARASAEQRRKILAQGIRAMESTRAFELLEQILLEQRTRAVIADLEPRVLGRLGAARRRFDPALLSESDGRGSTSGESLREAAMSADSDEAIARVAEAVAGLLSGVVGLKADRLDLDASLGRYGLDSLMFAQLQTWIDDQLGLRTGLVRLMRGPSIRELAAELVAELHSAAAPCERRRLLQPLNDVRAPRARIVCFPPMAMEFDVFSKFADQVPDDVEVLALDLPTLATDDEQLLRAPIAEQTARVLGELASLEPAPLVLYGHSMGAYVALTVARAMAKAPALLVAGAVPVPRTPPVLHGVEVAEPEDITDSMAAEAIRRFVVVDHLTGASRQRVIDLSRRDLWLTSLGRQADPTAPSNCPALMVGGTLDPIPTIDDAADPQSAARTLGYEHCEHIDGDHLFIQRDAGCRALIDIILQRLSRSAPQHGEPMTTARSVDQALRRSNPAEVRDMVDLLRLRASSGRGRYTFLEAEQTIEISVPQILRRAAGVSLHLRETLPPKTTVALMHPPSLEYIVAFFGTLMAGLTPVPVYPPEVATLDRSLSRLYALLDDAGARAILTSGAVVPMVRALSKRDEPLRRRAIVATDEIPEADDDGAPGPGLDAVAFLQYTSGSTRAPKGVRVTHGNLLANLDLMQRAFGISDATGVSWLPPYHDMGLIAGNLLPVYTGMHAVLMAPLTFLQRPVAWLEAMSRYRGEICGAPNFAYDLAARRAKPEEIAALDLSAWKLAVCGAEPINPSTLRTFSDTFAPAGFSPRALFPCYGLAEATLLVTGPRRGEGMRTLRLDKEALLSGRAIVSRAAGSTEVVSCGRALAPVEVTIASPDRVDIDAVPDGVIGEIVVHGPCIADGYHRGATGARADDERHAFAGGAVRTGDLGFVHDAEIYVVGRIKDVLIVRGRKHHPHDIEATVAERVDGMRLGRVLLGGWEDEAQPRAVIMVEPQGLLDIDHDRLVRQVQTAVRQAHGISVEVAVLEPGRIPKTSSGKLRRVEAIAMLRAGEMKPVHVTARLDDWLAASAPRIDAVQPRDTEPAEPEPEHSLILARMRSQLAVLLECSPDTIDVDAPLGSGDFDSLTAAEMGAEVEDAFGVTVQMAVLFEGLSLSELALRIAGARRRGEVEIVAAAAPVVVGSTPVAASSPVSPGARSALPRLSLFLFQSGPAASEPNEDLYDVVRRAAKMADQAGFEAIWLPERHFHPFGAPFPNPAVLAAAIAADTSRLRLRAGSVVLPLHHPVRVAEEWAMVDRLSGGRVGLSFTPGWNPRDFVLVPDRFRSRAEDCRAAVEVVRALWRGDTRQFPGGDGGPVEISVFPRPRQPELPVWLTCTDREERFVEAGTFGFNVLTALLLQDVYALGGRIDAYRQARRGAGHEGPGNVTLAVHTHVAATDETAVGLVRAPFRDYLASSADLWKQVSRRLESMTERHRENALDYALERYVQTATLIGSPKTCRDRLAKLAQAGVDEVACQIDFGLPPDQVMNGLPHLVSLQTTEHTQREKTDDPTS